MKNLLLITSGILVFTMALITLFNQFMSFFTTGLAVSIILFITAIFINRKYQNQTLYFSLIILILVLTLIFTYLQVSTPIYKGNKILDYSIAVIFVLMTLLLVYDLKNKMDKYQEAVAIYDDSLKTNPQDTIAWNNKGTTLISINEYQEAIKCFDKALKIDPKDAAAWHNKGVGLEKLGKQQEAIKYYDQALELDPKFEQAKKDGKIILEN
ncbi:tetratricopeptide repeat protein [Methanobacterium sp. CWC-01]|uniref:tetratricopeptide repeat protein n=1 Tax=Methanobacterium aridiramus TaxID=2584467 RepID=UPI00257638D2|nr:tetratricopeptide repeat protein [Methanobacterium sp. CWC-01]WJI09978.1 tetratricopeptide repeat protein [Methanobacterium sp. CWC-01]